MATYQCTTRFFCAPLKLYIPVGGQITENSDDSLTLSGVPRTPRYTITAATSWTEVELVQWFTDAVKAAFFSVVPETPEGGTSALLPPEVSRIDAANGIVYFSNPTGYQIEVYKYTRHRVGSHEKGDRTWPDRQGKRYKVLYQLPYGATSWTMPSQWIRSKNKRSHFKFGVRALDGTRSGLSVQTVITAIPAEASQGIKLLLEQLK